MKRINKYLIFLILCIGPLLVYSQCRIGRLDFDDIDDDMAGPGEKVDWWFLIKVNGFSDVFLYMDSLSNKFRKGYYLRSKESALGRTMKQYLETKDAHWLMYNDQALVDGSFINVIEGAHEKGFIGFKIEKEEDEEKWSGAWIQHSLPRFPSVKRNTFIPPLEYNIVEHMKLLLPFIGFSSERGFFNSNLLSKTSQGSVNKEHIEKERYQIYTHIESMNNIVTNYKFGKDIYFNARIYDGGVTSQHMFCVSLYHEENIIQLFQYLSQLSNDGIGLSRSGEFDALFKKKKTPAFNKNMKNWQYEKKVQDPKYYGKNAVMELKDGTVDLPKKEYTESIKSKIFNFLQKPGSADYYKPNNKEGEGLFYMKINGGSNNENDVWKSLVLCKPDPTKPNDLSHEPCLKRNDENKLIQNQMTVSTWAQREKEAWYGDGIFKKPYFTIDSIDLDGTVSPVSWIGNSGSDHSKIGWKHEPADDDLWNFCVSGGNLSANRREEKKPKTVKSSVLVCFKSKRLVDAINLLVTYEQVDQHKNTAIKKKNDQLLQFSKSIDTNLSLHQQEKSKPPKRPRNVKSYAEKPTKYDISDEEDVDFGDMDVDEELKSLKRGAPPKKSLRPSKKLKVDDDDEDSKTPDGTLEDLENSILTDFQNLIPKKVYDRMVHKMH